MLEADQQPTAACGFHRILPSALDETICITIRSPSIKTRTIQVHYFAYVNLLGTHSVLLLYDLLADNTKNVARGVDKSSSWCVDGCAEHRKGQLAWWSPSVKKLVKHAENLNFGRENKKRLGR